MAEANQPDLSMSGFLAYTSLLSVMKEREGLAPTDAIKIIRSARQSCSSLNFNLGLLYGQIFGWQLEIPPSAEGLREFTALYVARFKPYWLHAVPSGWARLRSVATENTLQCLREAGGMSADIDSDTLRWWDSLAAQARADSDIKKMENARKAEKLSYDYEIRRTRSLGIRYTPLWVSLEDNSVGYDILSFDLVGGTTRRMMIEVKSTTSNTVYITRNEWRNAEAAKGFSLFHIWRLPEAKLLTVTPEILQAHIPVDSGSGQWQQASIAVDFDV